MKFTLVKTKERDEVVVYASEENALTEAIRMLAEGAEPTLIGWQDKTAIKLNPADIACFTVEDNKIFAHVGQDCLQIKCRLYQLEERFSQYYVKINQSCLANLKQIARVEVSFSGTLQVTFKNGYTDYVSRRQLKIVKERFGI